MAFKISSVSQVAKSTGINLLVYGEPGVGKTTLLSTVPDPSRLLILSAEAGLRSIENIVPDAAAGVIESMADLDAAIKMLEKDSSKYDWVGIDSLSEIAKLCLAEEMKKTANGIKAYGELGKIIRAAVTRLRDLPMNVVFIASQEQIQDDEGRLLFTASFPGKMLCHGSESIPYMVDFVWPLRMLATEGDGGKTVWKRALGAQPDGRYRTKSRLKGAPRWVPTNLAKVLELIEG